MSFRQNVAHYSDYTRCGGYFNEVAAVLLWDEWHGKMDSIGSEIRLGFYGAVRTGRLGTRRKNT